MKLKENIDVSAFLETAEKCSGDIFLHMRNGDILNVKSLLSRYVFVSVCKPGELQHSRVVCTNDDDYAILSEYLQPVSEE